MNILLAILATYSVSILLTEYDGPWDIFVKMRKATTRGVFACAVCLSCWVAMPFCFAFHTGFFGYFAVIGGAILIVRTHDLLH